MRYDDLLQTLDTTLDASCTHDHHSNGCMLPSCQYYCVVVTLAYCSQELGCCANMTDCIVNCSESLPSASATPTYWQVEPLPDARHKIDPQTAQNRSASSQKKHIAQVTSPRLSRSMHCCMSQLMLPKLLQLENLCLITQWTILTVCKII